MFDSKFVLVLFFLNFYLKTTCNAFSFRSPRKCHLLREAALGHLHVKAIPFLLIRHKGILVCFFIERKYLIDLSL